MYLSGTSMATPLTAGSCALARQYLVQQRGHTPSGALVKAIMINGAVDIGLGVPNNR
jgi:subtilase family serine protease